MSHLTVNNIFNELVARSPASLRVRITTKAAYESLRTSLTRLTSKHRSLMVDLGDSETGAELSLCASFSPQEQLATFKVDRRTIKQVLYEVLTDQQIQEVPHEE